MNPQDFNVPNSSTHFPQPASHRVHGRLTTPGGRPVPGVTIRALDRSLRSEQALGETTTDRNGRYEISYSPGQLQRVEKESVDLLVRALPEGAPPVDSPIVFNARPEET